MRQAEQKALGLTGAMNKWIQKQSGMENCTIKAEDQKGSKGDAMF